MAYLKIGHFLVPETHFQIEAKSKNEFYLNKKKKHFCTKPRFETEAWGNSKWPSDRHLTKLFCACISLPQRTENGGFQ